MRWFNRIIPIFQMRKLRHNERLVQGQPEKPAADLGTSSRRSDSLSLHLAIAAAHLGKARLPNRQPFHKPKRDLLWLSGQKPEDDSWPGCHHQLNAACRGKNHPLFVLTTQELPQSIKPLLIPLQRELLAWSQTHASLSVSRVRYKEFNWF